MVHVPISKQVFQSRVHIYIHLSMYQLTVKQNILLRFIVHCIDSVYGFVRLACELVNFNVFLPNCTQNIDQTIYSVSHWTNCQFFFLQRTSPTKPYTESIQCNSWLDSQQGLCLNRRKSKQCLCLIHSKSMSKLTSNVTWSNYTRFKMLCTEFFATTDPTTKLDIDIIGQTLFSISYYL